jgi:hypothetical protein
MKESKRNPVTKADLAKNGYREQYGVIIVCNDEKHQKKIYGKLNRQGLKCRVLVT